MANITMIGSSIVSAYWNGAATYYRGICKALAARGHAITFVEQDILERQQRRDIEPPSYLAAWRLLDVSAGTEQLEAAIAEAGQQSEIVICCSGLGANDGLVQQLVAELPGTAGRGLLNIFWDVDAPATLEQAAERDWPFSRLVQHFAMILTYGGGLPVVEGYQRLGARAVYPVYNAVDPEEYHVVVPDPQLACDLLLMANRLPDREARIHDLFFAAARLAPDKRFILGGEGWADVDLPANVRYVGHVPTTQHNVMNCSAQFVLNVNRQAMVDYGYSPPTRVFEAAGCASCLITDAWKGVEMFLEPGHEVLVAASAEQIASYLYQISAVQAQAIGAAARQRVLAAHTYDQRATQLDTIWQQYLAHIGQQ